MIHDVFLNDALNGPLPIALYSAALFCLTEGRAYSAAEYRTWLTEAVASVEARERDVSDRERHVVAAQARLARQEDDVDLRELCARQHLANRG